MVLIVDNDKTRSTLLTSVLKNENIEVDTANSIFEINNIFNENAPEIVLFDFSIQWFSTCNFISSSRKSNKYNSTVFMLLANNQNENVPTTCQFPDVEIIQYPVSVNEFINVIYKYIQRAS